MFDLPVLLVAHDMELIFAPAARVLVMDERKVLIHGDVEAARTWDRGREICIGAGTSAVAATARRGPAGQGRLPAGHGQRPSRECHTPHDVSFDVRQGEILRMQGRNRAGKTAPLKALIGKAPASSAAVALDGEVIAGLPSAAIARAGVGCVPQGRGLSRARRYATASNPAASAAAPAKGTHQGDDRTLQHFPQRAGRMDTEADRLSWSAQQMAALARALSSDTGILLPDEPFDPRAPAVVEQLSAPSSACPPRSWTATWPCARAV